MTATQATLSAAAAVIGFWLVGAYNRLVRLRSALVGRFAAVDSQYRQRQALLAAQQDWLASTLASAGPRLEALRAACSQAEAALDKARVRPGAASAITSLRVADEILADARARLPVAAAPPTGDDDADHHQQLADNDTALAFARREFNDAVVAYNQAIAEFPTWVAARLFSFRPAAVF